MRDVGTKVVSLGPPVANDSENLKTVTYPEFTIPAGKIPALDEADTDEECLALVRLTKTGDIREAYGKKERRITLAVRAIEYPIEDTDEVVEKKSEILSRY